MVGVKDKGVKNLTMICSDAVGGWTLLVDADVLVKSGQIKKIIGSFMAYASPKKVTTVEEKVLAGEIELD